MLVDASPYGPGASGSRLSNSTTALLLASRPVTTRRMSDAMAVDVASASATAGQSVIFSIESSPVCIRPPGAARSDALRPGRASPVLNASAGHSTMARVVAGRCMHGARSHRFLVHDGEHVFVSHRDAVARGGTRERDSLPLAAVSSAGDPAGDEARPVRRQADEVRLHVARHRAPRGDVRHPGEGAGAL